MKSYKLGLSRPEKRLLYQRQCLYVTSYTCRVYFRKLDKGGQLHIREILGGGNIKTCMAIYEEGLFDLRWGNFSKGANLRRLGTN